MNTATFNEDVKNNPKDVFLMVYAPWCGHCKALKPTWEKVGTLLKKYNNNNVVMAKVDFTANELY